MIHLKVASTMGKRLIASGPAWLTSERGISYASKSRDDNSIISRFCSDGWVCRGEIICNCVLSVALIGLIVGDMGYDPSLVKSNPIPQM